MTESWRDRLRAAIERSGRTSAEIAAEAELSAEMLERILTGDAEAPFEVVVALAWAAEVRVGWLLGELPQPSAEPVLEEIPLIYADRGARLVYKACDHSMMQAGIAEGDLLFVKPTEDIGEAEGRIVVCRVDGVEHVRRLHVQEGQIRLLGTTEMDAIDVAGRELILVGIVIGRLGAFA